MEEKQTPRAHRLVLNNRKTGTVTGVLDVLSFDLNEVLLETEQGMLMVKGSDLHVNQAEPGEGGGGPVGHHRQRGLLGSTPRAKTGETILSRLFR